MDVQIDDALEPARWIPIARWEARRWQRSAIDVQDLEGAILERFTRHPPTSRHYAEQSARWAAIDFARSVCNHRAGHEPPMMLEDELHEPTTDEHGYADIALQDTVNRQLALLSPANRQTWLLHRAGYTYREIGVMFGVSEAAIHRRICVARKKIGRGFPKKA